MFHKLLKTCVIGACLALAVPIAAQARETAEWWHHHPAYVQAMSDVRLAYWLIQHRDRDDPEARPEESRAMMAIRVAYQTLTDASAVDRQDTYDQPPPNTDFYDHRGRLHHALDLLHAAHDAIATEEDDRDARDLRAHALYQIDDAARATDAAIHAWNY